MLKISNFQDVKIGDVLLFVDIDGKIRGFDHVKSIKNEEYEYYSLNSKNNYNGNLVQNFKKYNAFKSSFNEYEKYNDKELQSAILTWDYDYVMSVIYDEEAGSIIWKSLMKNVYSDFSFRMKFIDLTHNHKSLISMLSFQDDQKCISPAGYSLLKKLLSELFN